MKKYKSVKAYVNMLNKFYDPEDNANLAADLEAFVNGDQFIIFDLVGSEEADDNIIQIRDKYFWMCEYSEGVKFLEIIDEDEVKAYI